MRYKINTTMPRSVLGFTLIELLVVISIIGLLSSVVLSSVNKASSKARDAERIQTLQQIQKALILYYDDNGHYPIAASKAPFSINIDANKPSSAFYSWETNLYNQLKNYIPILSVDPQNSLGIPPSYFIKGTGYTYWTDSTGSKYQLLGRLENSNTLSCSKNNYVAIIPYGGFGPAMGESLCGGLYTTTNANLYVISSE